MFCVVLHNLFFLFDNYIIHWVILRVINTHIHSAREKNFSYKIFVSRLPVFCVLMSNRIYFCCVLCHHPKHIARLNRSKTIELASFQCCGVGRTMTKNHCSTVSLEGYGETLAQKLSAFDQRKTSMFGGEKREFAMEKLIRKMNI